MNQFIDESVCEFGGELPIDEPPDHCGFPLNRIVHHGEVWIEWRGNDFGHAGQIWMVRGELNGVVQVSGHFDVDLVDGRGIVAIEIPVVQEERTDDATALGGGHPCLEPAVQIGLVRFESPSVALVILPVGIPWVEKAQTQSKRECEKPTHASR